MSASNGALVPKADPSVVPGHGSKASVLPSRTPAHNHNEATPESPTLPTAASHPGHGMLSSPPLLKHAGSEPFEPYGRDTEAVSSDSTVGNDESSGKPQHSPTMPFDFVAATEAINKNELHTSHSSPSAEDSPRKDGGFKQQSSSDASTISNVERHRGRGRDSSDEIPLEGMPDSKRVRIAEPPSTPTTVHGQVIDRASPKLSSQGSSEDTVRLSTNTSACSSDDVRSDLLSTHHDDLNPLNPPTEKRDSSMSSTPKSASSLSSDTSRALTRPFRPPTAGQSASSTTPTSDLSLSSPAKGSASRSFRLKRPTNFKAPNAIGVSCSSSSSGASSRRIGLDPTRAQINQLEARLRTLRLALRYQREEHTRPLGPLIAQWRTAGQEAVKELFSSTPAPDSNPFSRDPSSNWGWDGSDIGNGLPSQPIPEQKKAEEEVPWTPGRMLDLMGLPKELLGWHQGAEDFV